VTKEGYTTTLPIGSIVSPLTHDLGHVQAQGFEWEPVAAVQHEEDQMGVVRSTAVAK
jgi:hypothetical protein